MCCVTSVTLKPSVGGRANFIQPRFDARHFLDGASSKPAALGTLTTATKFALMKLFVSAPIHSGPGASRRLDFTRECETDHIIRSYCAGSENRRASVWRSPTGSAKVSLNTVRTIQHAVSWVVVDG